MTNNPVPQTPDEVTEPHISDLNPTHIGVMIVAGMFVTTLAQPGVLARIPLQNILKNHLHEPAEITADFFFWIGLAWYFKPIAGILTDAFPLFRTRRRSYLLISAILAGLSWIVLAGLHLSYSNLLYATIVVNVFMVMASTVVGAYLVEAGQRLKSTGRLSSLRQATMSFCTLIQGPVAGWLAQPIPLALFGLTFVGAASATRMAGMGMALPAYVCAACLFALVPVAWVFMRERRAPMPTGHPLEPAARQLGIIFRARNLWFAILFVALYYFAPGVGTLQYYRQNDVLKISQEQIGFLGTLGGLFGMIATGVYAILIRRLPIRTMLFAAVAFAAASSALYVFYNSLPLARIIDSQNGFFGIMAEVVLLDLAARATPRGCEGLGYSLILSVRNLSLFGADKLGAHLAKDYHLSWNTMVWLNAGTTAVVLVIIPFLPTALMMQRDEKVSPDAAQAA